MTHLTEAVSNGTAWAAARELAAEGDATAATVAEVCAAIFEATEREATRLAGLATDLAITIEPDSSGQLHLLRATSATRRDAQRFVAQVQDDGYVGWQDFQRGARESFFRHEHQATLVRLDGVAFTLVVRWDPSRRATTLPSALRPSAADHRFVDLPSFAWPAYVAIRPIRLFLDRVRGIGEPKALGPILSTPESLLGPLLDFAKVTQSDHLYDLGCGEGRVVVEAACRHGCRATGVEQDPRLVEMARDLLSRSSVDPSLVSIIEGDAASIRLDDATVVFLFIPAGAVAESVQQLRAGGFEGRIITHEQQFVPGPVTPVESKVLIGTDALTIAHRW